MQQMTGEKEGYHPPALVSQVLCMSDSNFFRLAKEGIIPKGEEGKYPLIPCVQAYIKYLQQGSQYHKKEGEGWNAQRTRHMKVQADLAELKLQKEKNEVVSVADLQASISGLFLEVRTNIRNIPERVCSLIIGETDERQLKKVLLQEIDITLTSIADSEIKINTQDEGENLGDDNGEY